jgi:flagellar motor switch protein FliG
VIVVSEVDKALVFLLSLEPEVAARVVSLLSDGELRRVRDAAERAPLADSGLATREVVFREFVSRSSRAVAVPRGAARYIEQLAGGRLDEQEPPVPDALQQIAAARGPDVAAILEREPAQLSAALLAQLPSVSAARILEAMPPEREAAIVLALGRLSRVPQGVLAGVAAAVAKELPIVDEQPMEGFSRAAAILNARGRKRAGALLEELGKQEPALADRVRQAMFTFEDLASLEPVGMRLLLREVRNERLTVALKGARPEVTQAILASMSERAARVVRDDLESLRVKSEEIEAVRREMVQIALRLEADGILSLRGDDSDG